MSDSTTHDNHTDVRIQSKVNFYGPVLLSMGMPFVGLALVIFGVWMWTHWTTFVAMTPLIVDSTLALVGALSLILVAGLLVKIVLHPVAHLRGQSVRNKLVAEHENYVVVARKNGELELLTASQEKHVYNYRVAAGTLVNEEKPLALPAPSIPTFTQLLAQGVIQGALSKGQMLIGFVHDTERNEWVARFGSWLDLYSCAIAGVLGSGKTTTALFLLLQALLSDARMILIDPHLHDPEESLAYRLRMFTPSMVFEPCDDTPSEMLDRVRWTKNEFKRRKALGIKGPALIIVFEEFNAVMRKDDVAKEVADLLTIIEQEARKFGIFAILVGQYWSQQGIGAAVIRQCLASALVHRMGDVEQSKKLLGLPQYAKASLQLSQGHHVFKDTRGGYAETVTPAIVDADLAEVARLVPGSIIESGSLPVREQFTEPLEDLAPNPTKSKPKANHFEQVDDALQARARDIIKLMAQGQQKPDVMRLIWGIAPSKSDAYKKAEAEYIDAMKLVGQMIAVEQESEAN